MAGFRRADLAHPDDAELRFFPVALHDYDFTGTAQAARTVHARAGGADVDGLHLLLEWIAVGVDSFHGNANLLRKARFFLLFARGLAGGNVGDGCLGHDSPLKDANGSP